LIDPEILPALTRSPGCGSFFVALVFGRSLVTAGAGKQ
jgi:hypothetical protein